MFRSPVFVLGVVLAGCLCAGSDAQIAPADAVPDLVWLTEEERQWLKDHPVIRVAPTPDYPPFEYWEGDGDGRENFKGVVSSYLAYVEDELGIEFEMVRTNMWQENISDLKLKNIDAVSLLVPWDDRDYARVSEPYIVYPALLIVNDRDTRDGLTLADFTGKRVAVPKGYTGESYLRREYPEISVVDVVDPAQGIHMVSKGDVDAFFGGYAVVNYMAKRDGVTNIRIAGETEFIYANGFGVREDWAIFAGIFSKTLDRLSQSQRTRFYDEWVTEELSREVMFYDDRRFWAILCGLLAVGSTGAFLMLAWNRRQARFIELLAAEKRRTVLANKRLDEARREAERANDAKSSFVANISHEIRTPMHGVLGMCDLLRETGLTREQLEYLDYAANSAGNLVSLINDILDVSKIEAGKLDIEQQPFSLFRLTDEVIALMSTQARPKGVDIELARAPDVGRSYLGDELRIRQILLNLLSNAVKFTNEGVVRLTVSCDKTAGADQHIIRFDVSDTGIGISPDKLDAVFEPYKQEDGSTSRHFGGTGLGLSICKTLAEMMGGTAFAQSERGKGSKFSFTVLLQPVTSQEPAPPQTEQGGRIERAPRKLRILLAEDALVNQMVATNLLRKRGHEVDVAGNGREALELLDRNRYDAVLMDIEMPEMDGMTALRRLRESETHGEIRHRVIAMTGHAMTGDRERFLAAGMDGHLVKPFKPDELFAVVEIQSAASDRNEPERNREMAGEQEDSTPEADKPAGNKTGAQAQDTASGVLDRDAALQATGGDVDLAKVLLETCIDEVPQILERARDAVARADFVTARRNGHSLKSSFGSVGALDASEKSKALEFCESESADEFNDAIGGIEQAFHQMVFAAENFYPG
ncbi:MAG: transporter substrate-binding domain-containing protein [Planctomycetota bacterium]